MSLLLTRARTDNTARRENCLVVKTVIKLELLDAWQSLALARSPRSLASANRVVGICIDYRRHLANMTEQNTVTECPFLPLIYFRGIFRESALQVFYCG